MHVIQHTSMLCVCNVSMACCCCRFVLAVVKFIYKRSIEHGDFDIFSSIFFRICNWFQLFCVNEYFFDVRNFFSTQTTKFTKYFCVRLQFEIIALFKWCTCTKNEYKMLRIPCCLWRKKFLALKKYQLIQIKWKQMQTKNKFEEKKVKIAEVNRLFGCNNGRLTSIVVLLIQLFITMNNEHTKYRIVLNLPYEIKWIR